MQKKIKNKIKSIIIQSYSELKSENKEDNLHLSLTLGKSEMSKKSNGILPLLKISERLKKTFKNEIELRNGLKLIINDYELKKGVVIDFKIINSPLEFVFCLSGRISASIETMEGSSEEVIINKAMNLVFSFPQSKGKIVVTPLEPVKIVSIHISPTFLKEFIDNDINQLPDDLKNFIINREIKSFLYEGNISPEMYVAINQIIDCEYKGIAKKMYFESKALELLTLQISQLYKDMKSDSPESSLSEYEIHQTKKIKNYLLTQFNKPISLSEISTLAGMSHTKLNRCFKTLYGTTVFHFLRKQRLEYSRYLLNEGKLNITEIVYEAGWSNPSHFTKQFSKHFGTTPKSYQMSK